MIGIIGLTAICVGIYTLAVGWSVWYMAHRAFRQGIWASYGKVEPPKPKKTAKDEVQVKTPTTLEQAEMVRRRIKV